VSEEAPKNPTQELAQKLELLSGERMEKNFPGLKAEFDSAVQARNQEAVDSDAFWSQIELLFRKYGVDGATLDRILADRS